SWLLDNFWSFWVLALIVLFQPELRRALTRLGESRLFQGMALGAREERGQLIDEVIKAADALASKRIGALIVLERSTGLRNDAVVLIVSEEAGRISLAVDGQMESPLDLDVLRRRLAELFSLEEAPLPRRTAWWEPAREWLRK